MIASSTNSFSRKTACAYSRSAETKFSRERRATLWFAELRSTGSPARVRFAHEAGDEDGLLAVSYTHLTLPTKRIV